jgi:signal transduction histidine kinase
MVKDPQTELLSLTAHQLGAPLAGVRWSLSMLLSGELGPLTEAQQKVMEEGMRSAVRMAGLINSLLTMTRIEEGRFSFDKKRQALRPVVDAALDRQREAIAHKGLALAYVPEEALPELVIDEEKMAIVFDNLLDNAVKYTPSGGAIEVVLRRERDDIVAVVHDTGIGIPAAQMDRLFEKFFRAENAILTQKAGNGLGLYVAKNIVEAHGGTISVESAENTGTTFTIRLPIAT